MNDDTADEIAPLLELLHSAKNRVEIATMLIRLDKMDLAVTILEDLFCGFQYIVDKYCVKKR